MGTNVCLIPSGASLEFELIRGNIGVAGLNETPEGEKNRFYHKQDLTVRSQGVRFPEDALHKPIKKDKKPCLRRLFWSTPAKQCCTHPLINRINNSGRFKGIPVAKGGYTMQKSIAAEKQHQHRRIQWKQQYPTTCSNR